MCLRHGRREGNIGSSKAGIKCTCGLKGKMKDWVTKEMKEKSKTEKFKLDAISRSRGLIFIGQLEIYCPFRCNIRKYWDSMDFVLKISEREIFNTRAAPSSDRNIPSAPSSDRGILPASASNWKKSGKKMTKVDVQLNIPVNDLFAKLKDIYHTITSVTCSFEFFVILRLPIIGEFEVYLGFVVKDLKISDVLEKSLSFVSEQENHPYVFRILSDLFNRHYVSQDVLETCLSKMIFHDKDTITYCVARMALDIYKHKSVDSHDLGKFLSKLLMKMSHEETGGVVTSSKKREEEMGDCVARMALDIYNHKEVSSDDLGKFLSKLFKSQVEEEENMGVYVARMALDIYNHKSMDPHDLGKFLSKLFMKISHEEETGGVATSSKKREEGMGDCVARMALDIYNHKEVSSDDLGKFLSKLFKSQEEEEENMGVYVAGMALDIYKHKSVDPHDLGKFLSKLFMKMSHEEETGGVVTSSKQRQEEMGGCVARMALDIYNHKEKVSSGDLGKFLSILFKCPEEKTGDYVAQIVLDLYKGKAADSRPAMEGLIEIMFRESHPKVYRLLLMALDAHEGKLEEVKNDVLEFVAEMAPTYLAGFIRQYLASQRTGSKT